MEKIDKTIIEYEPMLYSLLKRFGIKRDYEDILQQLRIKMWKVLRDKRYKKIYKDKNGRIIEAKLSTWLYGVLYRTLLDILKTKYYIRVNGKEVDIDKLSIEKKAAYYIMQPTIYDVQSFPIESYEAENEAKCKLDFELYYSKLSKKDKRVLEAMISFYGDKKEVAKHLKCSVRNLNRLLIILKKDYKNYLVKGVKNG